MYETIEIELNRERWHTKVLSCIIAILFHKNLSRASYYWILKPNRFSDKF